MSRSGYTDDGCDDPLSLGRWRAQVASAIRGKRGQAFLRELAIAMDAMEDKVLISEELINKDGDCCAVGVVCKSRNIDVSGVDLEDTETIGSLVGVAKQLVAEIEYENDDEYRCGEKPEQRWLRMRKWVQEMIVRKDMQNE